MLPGRRGATGRNLALEVQPELEAPRRGGRATWRKVACLGWSQLRPSRAEGPRQGRQRSKPYSPWTAPRSTPTPSVEHRAVTGHAGLVRWGPEPRPLSGRPWQNQNWPQPLESLANVPTSHQEGPLFQTSGQGGCDPDPGLWMEEGRPVVPARPREAGGAGRFSPLQASPQPPRGQGPSAVSEQGQGLQGTPPPCPTGSGRVPVLSLRGLGRLVLAAGTLTASVIQSLPWCFPW